MELFQNIEDRYNCALESNDINEISKLLIYDWTLLEPSFGQISKESFLNSIRNGELVHLKMKKKIQNVKVYKDTAIVLTKGQNNGLYKNEIFDSETWITNIYIRKGADWIMVNSHECPVSCG